MRRTRGEAMGPPDATPIRPVKLSPGVARLLEEARDALELAVVSGAPSELVDRLALVVGLSHAILDLASDSPALIALTSSTLERGRIALEAWRTWQRGLLSPTG